MRERRSEGDQGRKGRRSDLDRFAQNRGYGLGRREGEGKKIREEGRGRKATDFFPPLL